MIQQEAASRNQSPTKPLEICYFVHDTSHADIARRVEMFDLGGAKTIVVGFRRRAAPDQQLAGRVVDLGQTKDTRFIQRILAVATTLLRMRHWAEFVRSRDVIIARNLEMLVLAAAARRRYAPHAALVYECLDIHRLMSAEGPVGWCLRTIEKYLLRSCQGLIVSSPGFIREHFATHYGDLPKVFVVENKVLAVADKPIRGAPKIPDGPPWRIGWYGIVRCRRSLEILTQALKSVPDLIEVVVAGRAAPDIFGESGEALRGLPGLHFLGPFRDEAALEELYRSVHFAWVVDYFEEGKNSDWLLPNRLYRSLLYGTVPIASNGVETGRWLREHRAGILLEEPLADTLLEMLRTMTNDRLAAEAAGVAAISRAALITDVDECRLLVRNFGALTSQPVN